MTFSNAPTSSLGDGLNEADIDAIVTRRLQADRQSLLDLSLRNPLLNYRARTRSLRIVGEDAGPIYQRLVLEHRPMAFLPRPEVESEPTPESESATESEAPSDLGSQPTPEPDDPAASSHSPEPTRSDSSQGDPPNESDDVPRGEASSDDPVLEPSHESAQDSETTEGSLTSGIDLSKSPRDSHDLDVSLQVEPPQADIEEIQTTEDHPADVTPGSSATTSDGANDLEGELDGTGPVLEDPPSSARINTASADLSSGQPLDVDQQDSNLQTSLESEVLQRVLRTLHTTARTAIEEQGVNTLYLALGLLHWSDPDSRREDLQAPLILIPVELRRRDASRRFRLRYAETELGENLSLATKLGRAFGIDWPSLPESIEELDPHEYFDRIETCLPTDQPGWRVDRDAITLDVFSFSKFLMYADLDPESWSSAAPATRHPILRALLGTGFAPDPEPIDEEGDLEPWLDPEQTHQVLDADSSQSLAIQDALRGRNLVIQGPPGTGKSQTIVNLVAEAVARGKTVLFVAEKLAALQVVRSRLDAIGLGELALELHSQKMRRKAVLDDLRNTLDLGRPRLDGQIADDQALWTEHRDRLRYACEAVNHPWGSTETSPFEALGRLLEQGRRLRTNDGPDLPPIDVSTMSEWTRRDRMRKRTIAGNLQKYLTQIGVPRDHPFWGSGRADVLMPSERGALAAALQSARLATETLREAVGRLSSALALDPPTNRQGLRDLFRAAGHGLKAGAWRSLDVADRDWLDRADALDELIRAGRQHALILQECEATLMPEAWKTPVLGIRRDLNAEGRSWHRFFSGRYREATRQLAGLCRGPLPRGLDERLALLDAIREVQRLDEVIQGEQELADRLWKAAPPWRGVRSDWERMAAQRDELAALHKDFREGRIDPALIGRIDRVLPLEELTTRIDDLKAAQLAHTKAWSDLETLLRWDDMAVAFGDRPFASVPFDDQLDRLDRCEESLDAFQDWVGYVRLAEEARVEGLEPLVQLAESWPEAAEHLLDVLDQAWHEFIVREANQERAGLADLGLDPIVEQFNELDRRVITHNRSRLAQRHWQRMPRGGGLGQLGELRREFEKKSRHWPIRKLVARTGHAIQAIKPVWMMSPLSVAQYLPPDGVRFDLVVFDEASQVRPVDAFGALLRGDQAIVVGDSKQLPPSDFFQRIDHDLSDEPDDAQGVPASSDVESILSLFQSQGASERMLRWHYRSRHESLIQVSNQVFYDDRLVVFPSPDASRERLGLILRHHPETVYQRGGSRTNPEEAHLVAEAVMRFAGQQEARTPSDRWTLGVAAFSTAQRQAIEDALEELRRADPRREPFFQDEGLEPFFIKNLENVQGDERDVIFVSLGYGRDEQGRIALNFGPVNLPGGERRLNVLFTRARQRCEVFTNLRASEIDRGRTSSRGVAALIRFLEQTEAGLQQSQEYGIRADRNAPGEESHEREQALDVHANGRSTIQIPPMILEIAQTLEEAGLRIDAGVGGSGQRIDLAVEDPEQPGRYRLAIESDGPSYAAARTVRDRDRLRPEVLRRLGWHWIRVRGFAWFRDPIAQRERILNALAQAIEESLPVEPNEPSETESPGETSDVRTEPVPEVRTASRSENRPTRQGLTTHANVDVGESVIRYPVARPQTRLDGKPIDRITLRKRTGWIRQVVEIESPVHVREVLRRLTEALGYKRTSAKVQGVLQEAIDEAVRRDLVIRRGEFLWMPGRQPLVLRDRSELPAYSRRWELVAPEEQEHAVLALVERSFGIEPDQVASAVAKTLGFGRVNDAIRKVVADRIDDLLSRGRLQRRGPHLVLAEPEAESANDDRQSPPSASTTPSTESPNPTLGETT